MRTVVPDTMIICVHHDSVLHTPTIVGLATKVKPVRVRPELPMVPGVHVAGRAGPADLVAADPAVRGDHGSDQTVLVRIRDRHQPAATVGCTVGLGICPRLSGRKVLQTVVTGGGVAGWTTFGGALTGVAGRRH